MPDQTANMTVARKAVWQAVKGWPRTRDAFAKLLEYDKEILPADPENLAPQDLPLLSIFPAPTTPNWQVQQGQLWPYNLKVELWTPGWLPAEAEWRLEAIVEAANSACPPNETMPYVRKAGCRVLRPGTVTMDRTYLRPNDRDQRGPRIVFATMLLTVGWLWNPQT